MNYSKKLLLFVFIFTSIIYAQKEKRIIYLSWKNVIDISLKENLSLKSKSLDYEIQNFETWKSLSNFLPSLSYQGIAQKNIELPVFVFMGQRFVVGTPYNFQHSFNLSLPLFTGGARWFNYNIQNNIRKSLKEELEGKEEETVLNAMQAYYAIILANEMCKTAEEAIKVAKQNLEQVKKFYNAGTATELDLQRAKAQYSSTLPVYESALSNKKLSMQRLKMLLNIPLEDSLVVIDSLDKQDFLNEYENISLDELKAISKEKRNDLKALKYQQETTKAGEKIALSSFAPTVAIMASLDYAAPMENTKVTWNDYIRSKSLTLSLSWQLFDGGKRIIDYQIAKIKSDQMNLYLNQAQYAADLEIEQSYYSFNEASKNLQSLKDALEQYKESLRISNLLYSQGMSSQLDVLNAQLLYTKSKSDYLQGIYNYNVSQLALLKSIGLLDKIWK
ncbi:TolC family protein [Rosettibacter firmus]|uniref:TolC family protein n=1 Tax=Rosettibacter firmus TaxID=3111522 RepID=UPI00336C047F